MSLLVCVGLHFSERVVRECRLHSVKVRYGLDLSARIIGVCPPVSHGIGHGCDTVCRIIGITGHVPVGIHGLGHAVYGIIAISRDTSCHIPYLCEVPPVVIAEFKKASVCINNFFWSSRLIIFYNNAVPIQVFCPCKVPFFVIMVFQPLFSVDADAGQMAACIIGIVAPAF